jgi:hydroxymethylglutaryl-CoA synthase
MKYGIVGYGCFVPRLRIKVDEIARVWGRNGKAIASSLGVVEKAVANYDEDTATISVVAARNALARAGIPAKDIGAIYVGSESHPYVIKPTATIVAQAVGATPEMTAADLEFACKAGTAGMQACLGMCRAGMIDYGLVVGADTAQGRPGDALEYTAASGGAAFVIGPDPMAEILDTASFTTDTPDFWRREGERYPQHAARFTGEPAYFRHVIGATQLLLEKTKMSVNDFDHVVFHMPNGKFPLKAAKRLGIPKEKMSQGLIVTNIGNTYSGSSLLGLTSILDVAKSGDKVLMTSFGSGAGSDAFAIEVTDAIEEKRDRAPLLSSYAANKEYLDYALYVKVRKKLKF